MRNPLVPKCIGLCLEVVHLNHVNHCGVNRPISKTTWARDFKFGTRLCMGRPSGRRNIFKSACGLASRSVQWGNVAQLGKRYFRWVHRCRT